MKRNMAFNRITLTCFIFILLLRSRIRPQLHVYSLSDACSLQCRRVFTRAYLVRMIRAFRLKSGLMNSESSSPFTARHQRADWRVRLRTDSQINERINVALPFLQWLHRFSSFLSRLWRIPWRDLSRVVLRSCLKRIRLNANALRFIIGHTSSPPPSFVTWPLGGSFGGTNPPPEPKAIKLNPI